MMTIEQLEQIRNEYKKLVKDSCKKHLFLSQWFCDAQTFFVNSVPNLFKDACELQERVLMKNSKKSKTFEVSPFMNYATTDEHKAKVIRYCEENGITLSQFGRWSDEYFIECFPKRPHVKGKR